MIDNQNIPSFNPESDPVRQEALSGLYRAMLTRRQEIPDGASVTLTAPDDPDLVDWFTILEESVPDPYGRTQLPLVALGGQSRLAGGPATKWDLFFDGTTFDFIGEEESPGFTSLTADDVHSGMSEGQANYVLSTSAAEAEGGLDRVEEMRGTGEGEMMLAMEADMQDRSSVKDIRDFARNIEIGQVVGAPGTPPGSEVN